MKFLKELYCKWFGHKAKYPVHFCERCQFDLSEDYCENGLPRYKNPPPPPIRVWKNLKMNNEFNVIGRGTVFVVDSDFKTKIKIGERLISDNRLFEITGIESTSSSTHPIGLVCKELKNEEE